MSDKYKDAELILKLYELRREEVMRKARMWFFAEFQPESIEDFGKVLMGEHSAYFRMVSTYWDMASSFVNNGALDAKMFSDANAEHIGVFLKIEPFLEDLRKAYNMPEYMANLEQCCKTGPDAEAKLGRMRERMKMFKAAREEAAKKQAAGE